jgi:phage terminase large subunit-like protein
VVDVTAQIHAALVAEQLRSSEPVLRWLVEQGRVRIVSAFYRLETGVVEFPEANSGLEQYLVSHTRVADDT